MRDAVIPALPIADRDLELVLTGEAAPALVARVEALAREHPALAAHLAERRAEQAAFRVRHPRMPAALLPAGGAARPAAWWTHLLRTPVVSGACAAACVLAFVVMQPGASPEDLVRNKGARPGEQPTQIELIAKRGARVFAVQAGALLRPGDAVRVGVTCARDSVVVVGLRELDTKKSTLLLAGERVATGARTVLGGSFVLDDHLGAEQLEVVCAADEALAARAADAIVRGLPPPGAATIPLRKSP